MMRDLLERLGAQCPKMAFSNKIRLVHGSAEYRSSLGRHLLSSGGYLSIELLAQNRGSGNLFDMVFSWQGERFDRDAVLSLFKEQYDAFYTPADIESGRWPVVGMPLDLVGTALQHFVGDLYAAGASLLSDKLGEKVFSGKLTFCDDMNPSTSFETRFFDAEGCAAKDYRPVLVENGVLKGLLTTKKTAREYGLKNIGTADAPYDGVPGIGFHSFLPEKTAGTYRSIVSAVSGAEDLEKWMRRSLDATGEKLHISFDEWNFWYAWYRPSCAGEGIFAAAVCRAAVMEVALFPDRFEEDGADRDVMREVTEAAVEFMDEVEKGRVQVPELIREELRAAIESL